MPCEHCAHVLHSHALACFGARARRLHGPRSRAWNMGAAAGCLTLNPPHRPRQAARAAQVTMFQAGFVNQSVVFISRNLKLALP